MDMQETKKYIQMENILNKINQKYITLPPDEVKRNNKILQQVIDPLTDKIKEKSVLFKNMYEMKFYGGSFYDGIKVGKPEEFDLDYVINLPLLIEPEVEISNKPGFVHVRIKEFPKLAKHKEMGRYDKLDTLMVGNYLSTDKVLQWMEKAINLALNQFPKTPDGYRFNVAISEQETVQFYATVSKSHPAFTLKIKNTDGSIYLDIDLVPCFQFGNEQWPSGQYRKNPTQRNKFLVVPKKPYHVMNDENVEKYWRLSFQEQERILITGSGLKALKPSIKLLKKLRDKHNHKIASYFIKTACLWEAQNVENKDLWRQPFSYVFITMLKRYTELIKNKCIPYYWNKNFNLIGHIKEVTLTDIGNTLKRIIDQIEQRVDEPFTIAKYLVLPDELEEIRGEVQLGKKFLKKQLCLSSFDTSSSNNSDVSGASVEEIEENQPNDNKLLTELEKMDDIKQLFLTSHDIPSKSLHKSDVSSTIIETIEENRVVTVPDPLEKLNPNTHNIEQLCFVSFATSKSLDNLDVPSASIRTNRGTHAVAVSEARVDDNNKLLDALEKLDRKTDKIYDVVTELVTMNRNVLKICSDLTERLDDLEDKINEFKRL